MNSLNTRCTIQEKTVANDATYGPEAITWTLLGTRWCNVQDILQSKSEQAKNGLQAGRLQTRLRLRYCTDIDSTMRVIVNRPTPVIYQIVSGPAIIGDKEMVEYIIERNTVENV